MLRYSLAKLGRAAGRAKGTTAELPPIQVRLATEREYLAALRAMLSAMAKETRDVIIPYYRAEFEMQRARQAIMADARREWFASLTNLKAALVRIAGNTVSRILGLEAQRHTENFMETAKRAIGIDLRAVVRQEDLADHLLKAVEKNVSLIQGLADELQKRIEQTVYENSIAGNSANTLRKALQADFGFSEKRARLIARDQTAKFNGDMNRIRQMQAGVDKYTWGTSHDERVRGNPAGRYPNARPSHHALDGKTFTWDNGPAATGGLHPGQPIQCRCVGRGVVEF